MRKERGQYGEVKEQYEAGQRNPCQTLPCQPYSKYTFRHTFFDNILHFSDTYIN